MNLLVTGGAGFTQSLFIKNAKQTFCYKLNPNWENDK